MEAEAEAEASTPLPLTAARHQRAPMATRLHFPTTSFFVGSNDDHLERAQSRAARAAASIRRKVTAPPSPAGPGLSNEQIVELFHNCIKLASENKINQKNSWQLKLIDHLSEIIKVEAENDAETNFQKASCTLEAGVKIYSARVDAVHSEAYKILIRMNQASLEDEQEKNAEVVGSSGNKRKCNSKPGLDTDVKISPLSTLESSFEALNVKKFDVAFVVDPLYHQTSSLFDEGGAKGLLLNNLGIYGGCHVLFDSFDVPGKSKSYSNNIDTSDKIDLSFTKESVEQMVMNMAMITDISPTLKDIINLLDEESPRSLPLPNLSQESELKADAFGNKEPDFDCGISGNYDTSNFDEWDETSAVNERSSSLDSDFEGWHQDNDNYSSYKENMDDNNGTIPTFLLRGLTNTLKQNAWAGPDHWKYQRPKGPEGNPGLEFGPNIIAKRSRNKSILDVDIEFMEFLGKEKPNIFSPPQNPKSLLLAANRSPPSSKLPEDCLYQPQDILSLFLLPNVTCLEMRGRKLSEENIWQQDSDMDKSLPSWGNESVLDEHYQDLHVHNNDEVSDGLILEPHKVNKIEVLYEKISKQVDVHALKESLWCHIQDCNESIEQVPDNTLSFRHLLTTFSINPLAAATAEDISPHLCFICLLHLANEHSLSIHDCPDLDDLNISFPS